MRALVVGSGGREHALVWKLFASPQVDGIVCVPGNAGMSFLAQQADVPVTDVLALLEVATTTKADLTVVGPEAPLAAGIVDTFRARGLKVFGPTRAAARLETSKAWAKDFLQRHGIPTGAAEVVETEAAARAALARTGFPVVIKADGLAGGKGVWVVHDQAAAEEALAVLFQERTLGAAGDRVLIEEYLEGPELSILAFTDGERFSVMPASRDYKRLLDGDLGPNTGGMGGYTRPRYARPELLEQIEREILRPTIAGMAAEDCRYSGVLYAGIIVTRQGPKVLEFNCRFGDPEAQIILPLLESDLWEICLSVAEERFDPEIVRWGGGQTCGVVLAADGYPAAPRLGVPIGGFEDLEPGVLAFHGGTAYRGGGGFLSANRRVMITTGGRVVTIVATGPTLAAARELVYANQRAITYEGKVFRTDIGLEDGPAAGFTSPTDDAAPIAARESAVSAPGSPGLAQAPVVVAAADAREEEALADVVHLLRQLGIPFETSILSLRRGPDVAERFVRDAADRGVRVIIAGAGDEPELPGRLAAWSGLPVIAVPLPTLRSGDARASALDALDAPDGAPVALVSPDPRGCRSAAWLAASIVRFEDESLNRHYDQLRADLAERPRP